MIRKILQQGFHEQLPIPTHQSKPFNIFSSNEHKIQKLLTANEEISAKIIRIITIPGSPHLIKHQIINPKKITNTDQFKNKTIYQNWTEWKKDLTVQMSAGTRIMMEREQNQAYPTVKSTYLGTSGPAKYRSVTITIPRVRGSEIK